MQDSYDSEGKFVRKGNRMTPPQHTASEQWLSDSLDRLEGKIESIQNEGCAKREGDLQQLTTLDGKVTDIKDEFRKDIDDIKKTLNKIFIAIMAGLISALGYILQQVLVHFISHSPK